MTVYFVTTWDPDLEEFTPQIGVPEGPYTLWGLRPALRALRDMGYSSAKGPSVNVEAFEPLNSVDAAQMLVAESQRVRNDS